MLIVVSAIKLDNNINKFLSVFSEKGFISNWNNSTTEVDKLQYFLDMNVEGYILGVVWLLVIGNKIDNEIYEHSYGNRMRKNLQTNRVKPEASFLYSSLNWESSSFIMISTKRVNSF